MLWKQVNSGFEADERQSSGEQSVHPVGQVAHH